MRKAARSVTRSGTWPGCAAAALAVLLLGCGGDQASRLWPPVPPRWDPDRAEERCNGIDDDGDGAIDEADAIDASRWYPDADGDGYGDPAGAVQACDAPAGHVARAGDCDDTRSEVHPGAAESCGDRIDNDCDGLIDPPGGVEVCDGVDNDCDGAIDEADAIDASRWYPDADGDGYGDPAGAVRACAAPAGHVVDGTDCDDTTALANPGIVVDACGDGIDNDCDGLFDPPGGAEVCDGVDNDCDGAVDEGFDLDGSGTADCFEGDASFELTLLVDDYPHWIGELRASYDPTRLTFVGYEALGPWSGLSCTVTNPDSDGDGVADEIRGNCVAPDPNGCVMGPGAVFRFDFRWAGAPPAGCGSELELIDGAVLIGAACQPDPPATPSLDMDEGTDLACSAS